MWWRLAFPLIFTLAPRLIPRLARRVYLAWKLTFDRRVPLLLKLLAPATLIYIFTPFSRVPYAGPAGFIFLLSLAIWALVKFAPRDVVESYAPWMARERTASDRKQDSSRVVEGKYHMVDEEESNK